MVPSATTSSSKTLNARAPEYYPKTPVAAPYRHAQQFFLSPFPPPSCSASSCQFFPPPSCLPSPSIFCPAPEFYLPTSVHPQQNFSDIKTYYYIAPGNPNDRLPLPPPQAVVTADSSSTAQPEEENHRTASDRQLLPQVRQTRTTPSGGYRPGVRRGGLGRSSSSRRIEGRPAERNINVSRCSPKGENRHSVLSLKQDEENTTVMLKNIPYDCPREYLLELLDRFCAECRTESTSSQPEEQINASYDFVYLPIDFQTRKGRGFAFFNFTSSAAAWKFFDTFDSTEWDPLKWNRWPKKMEIARAKIQGKQALITHFSNSNFECETDDFLPVYFSPARDGSGHHFEMTSVGRRRAIPHWESPP
ncbi:hypothetical protein F511_06501 [Dorcoceras hygrometricum]|uniref:Mei2-like C-terminal RNA recognition motif domain-containing protein n=1 Tax=Dorcoceras hygrometricum TaxID=472368 RepID=A0A2Z7D4T2_9LAMI|nr:hypothetical protein F511_06501 [Dorcoceras hygrometricum]